MCFTVGVSVHAYSQNFKEFLIQECPCDPTDFLWEKGPEYIGYGVIKVNSVIHGLTLTVKKGRREIDFYPVPEKNIYYLIVEPTDKKDNKNYTIEVSAKGFKTVTFTTGSISSGGAPSFCCDIKEKVDLDKSINKKALLRSAFVPGWGQFYKDRNVRGSLIVIGETLTLAAGGLSLYNELNQKSIMDKPEVSYQDYIAAEKSYEQWNTARHISFITAAVIYSLNLVDAYLTPAKSQNNIVFTPNVMNANGELAVGATLSINF